jgi:hypothetical protein
MFSFGNVWLNLSGSKCSVKGCSEYQNTDLILYSIKFLKMYLYEVMCENMALPDNSQMSMLYLAV